MLRRLASALQLSFAALLLAAASCGGSAGEGLESTATCASSSTNCLATRQRIQASAGHVLIQYDLRSSRVVAAADEDGVDQTERVGGQGSSNYSASGLPASSSNRSGEATVSAITSGEQTTHEAQDERVDAEPAANESVVLPSGAPAPSEHTMRQVGVEPGEVEHPRDESKVSRTMANSSSEQAPWEEQHDQKEAQQAGNTGIAPHSSATISHETGEDQRNASPTIHPNITSDQEEEGTAISRAIGSDLFGDALEPTKAGKERRSQDHAHAADHGAEAAEGGEEHQTEHHAGEGEAEDEGRHHLFVALLFFFGVLMIGSGILMFLERCLPALPYTVALFIAGCMVSIVHYYKPPDSVIHWPSWSHSVEMWQHINPHLLFYSFLPALIFAEAMRMNTQLAAKCSWQVLLLACPGVLVGTALTGCIGRFILPYNWDWSFCFVFGTILSATDPVAVVALFNTLGVSPRLTLLVSGESLLNDGTAIVVFALMLKIALGAVVSAWDMLAFFGEMTITAAVFGFGLGFFAVAIIGKCAEHGYHSDAMIQVIVTICCGYLAFFIAESELSTSGVLSTVAAGSAVAYRAWPRFVSRETMHIVWETVEFIGNTVIFFLAGVIFADIVLSRGSYIQPVDFLWVLLVYACVMLVRASMVLLFWVPLNRLGTPITWPEAAVVVWSGLRGAVSLALAIVVDLEPGISRQMGSRLMFHVGGVAALTFLVNASTAGPLLRRLGLTRASRAREQMLTRLARHVAGRASEACDQQLRSGAEDVRFEGASAALVRSMLPTFEEKGVGEGEGGAEGALGSWLGDLKDEDPESLAAIYRETWLKVVQHHYWESIEEGVIPRTLEVARILLNSTEEGLDDSRFCLRDWDAVHRDVGGAGELTRLEQLLSGLAEGWLGSLLPWLRSSWSYEGRTMQKVYVALSFHQAHVHAEEVVPKYFRTGGQLDAQVLQRVAQESAQGRAQATELLRQIPDRFVELGKSEMLARRLCHMQLKELGHMKETGLLTSSEARHIEHQVLEASRQIADAPKDSWLSHGAGAALFPGAAAAAAAHRPL